MRAHPPLIGFVVLVAVALALGFAAPAAAQPPLSGPPPTPAAGPTPTPGPPVGTPTSAASPVPASGSQDGATLGGGAAAGAAVAPGSDTLAGQLAGKVLGAFDWESMLSGLLKGLYELVVGDGVQRIGATVAAFLVYLPNLREDQGSMANIQRLVDVFRAGAVFACLVAFTVTVVQFLIGGEQAPHAALGRLGAVLFALGFYRQLVAWVLRGSGVIANGVLTAGEDTTTGHFNRVLAGLAGATMPFWWLIGIIGALFMIGVCVAKIVGLALLLITYVAGPLLLPLAIYPRAAPWVGLWAQHAVKLLLWPLVWALELRVFGALAGGITLLAPDGSISPLSLASGELALLTSLATLGIMAVTPYALHFRLTLAGVAQSAGRSVVRVADAATLVATGGASATFLRGAARGFRGPTSP